MLVDFVKFHGAGNDFVLVDEWNGVVVPEKRKKSFVELVCRRHFGVGADGVIFVSRSAEQDACFVFFNPDGSRAEMCGNGIRCFAKYVYGRGYVRKNPLTVESLAGVKTVELRIRKGVVESVTVDLGAPKVEYIDRKVKAGGETFLLSSVDMGNPHAVIFVKDVDSVDVRSLGKEIRNNRKLFPRGVNVHFVEKVKAGEFRIRTFERGVEDETLACGTGICASASAAVEKGLADGKKQVMFHARGGDVSVAFRDKKAFMTGPAVEVFKGTIEF